ncbi:hypothetical protein GCM10007063_27570 [Lentibacillus kapialis]|uniref:histidine kinase n=1 Tax=Lentibacillus kapialis TaxID=340214 RepID=A0A917Q0F9_9BACI|nr:ATP-binding protein [Lentibacillus kapialis]GGK03728.1 hypothetical protein GCM10007063_27570 [Lentibacillus kapialis]
MEKSDSNIAVGSTTQVDSSAGRHIVYTYTDIHKYLINATAFIAEGIEKNQIVIYIDQSNRFDIILQNLKNDGFSEDQINEVIFADSDEFYEVHETFNIDRINQNLAQLMGPYSNTEQNIRIWGSVVWKDQDQEILKSRMNLHEHNYDCFISENSNLFAVCAYDALTLPTSYMNVILQTHQFHMTDDDLSASHLYKKEPILLPEIQEQIRIAEAEENEVIRSEKLHIAGELAANIAHELGNPLAVMKGFLQLINKTGDMSGMSQRYVNTISSQVEKMEQITSEFLALANPHLGNKEEIHIPQLIENVQILMADQAAHKAVEIQTKFDHKDIVLVGDETKIKQVLINLIKNAIEAMDQGYIMLWVKDLGDYIHINVIDNGPGIPKYIIDQIGEPFITTKESGTGLGLLISEKIVAGHNGKLVAESDVGHGATFTISLPKS